MDRQREKVFSMNVLTSSTSPSYCSPSSVDHSTFGHSIMIRMRAGQSSTIYNTQIRVRSWNYSKLIAKYKLFFLAAPMIGADGWPNCTAKCGVLFRTGGGSVDELVDIELLGLGINDLWFTVLGFRFNDATNVSYLAKAKGSTGLYFGGR